MKVRPTDPATAAGLIDPDTKRSPFIDPETGAVRESAEVNETTHWVRRLRAGEIALVGDAPTGLEPVTPLTTR